MHMTHRKHTGHARKSRDTIWAVGEAEGKGGRGEYLFALSLDPDAGRYTGIGSRHRKNRLRSDHQPIGSAHATPHSVDKRYLVLMI
jgi:hypothetical protein